MKKLKIIAVPLWVVILLFSCQEKTTKNDGVMPYTLQDSVLISDYYHLGKTDFNRIVDSFPNLYQYPHLHPDSCFAIGPRYIKWKNETGVEQEIDFDVTAQNQKFYDLYTHFNRKHNIKKDPARQRLLKIFFAMSAINDIVNYSGQENMTVKLKIPAIVEYALYQSKRWQSKQNEVQLQDEKAKYFEHLKEILDQKMNHKIATTEEYNSTSKRLNDYFLQIQQCDAFEFEQLKSFKESCFTDTDLDESLVNWGAEEK